MPVLTTFNCDALTGGTARALDAIPVASLVDGCRALVALDGAFLVFVFDADGTDAEETVSFPRKIRPNDYSSAGVWVEQYTGAPNQNLLINGGFDIWQRGTSFVTGTAKYTADRHRCLPGSGGSLTVSRQAFTPGQTDVPGNPEYYARVVQANSTDNWGLDQYIEGVEQSSGRQITVSGYAKLATAGQIMIYASQNFGVGGSDIVYHNKPVSIGTTWTRYEVTFNCSSVAGKTIGAKNYVGALLRVSSTGPNTLELANRKVEIGPVATPFVKRPIAEELALCQRYFYKTYDQDIAPGQLHWKGCVGFYTLAAISKLFYPARFPVTMRTAPTMALYSVTGAEGYVCNHTSGTNITVSSVANIGQEGFQNLNLGAAPSIGDEIYFHFSADAEL